MSTIFIQYDGTTANKGQLQSALAQAGLEVISVKKSRWRRNGEDRGPRLDIEIEDTGGDLTALIATLDAAMQEQKGNRWTEIPPGQQLR